MAPGGRFKYSYVSTTENSGISGEVESSVPTNTTESDTQGSDAADVTLPSITEVPTNAETDITDDQGCGSVLLSGMMLTALLGAAVVLKKRREA